MEWRFAVPDDSSVLAELNHQLIQDEGHRNPMTVEELGDRMRGWLASGEYSAVLFFWESKVVAYALYRETKDEIYLRQFFVVRNRRREGIGRGALMDLFTDIWSLDKRRTVSVLANNAVAISFWKAMGYTDYSLTLEMMPGETPNKRIHRTG
ncbi:GNAT family N-acetyltransferase [Limnochorda pilosa]|uniref:GCN5 family acetyltransferase n=1 Tax=Limnochorda pilosa TaxID=1555112 RepID=A0A0K2SI18_LIMPI|nr:GNAT family N-acetyltransferase [Limnochorda pilosa]BAS26748.1 GCN5 family acetyltransferase [Limnochorda pilosa]